MHQTPSTTNVNSINSYEIIDSKNLNLVAMIGLVGPIWLASFNDKWTLLDIN